jgi:hypothetical protein
LTKSQQDKQDRLYLESRRAGTNCPQIARDYDVSLRTVYRGIERARRLELPVGTTIRRPRLVPIAPLTPLTPLSTCPHRVAIKRGSCFVCLVCHQSGMDHHIYFRPHPLDPKPDKRPKAKPAPRSRKERRSILHRVQPSQN